MAKTELPFWRACLFPIVVTVAAVVFWFSYYRTVYWWPIALLAGFLANYSFHVARTRKRSSDQ